jgi:hypothetical protein
VEAAYTDVEDIKACYNFLNRAWAADTRVGASLAPNPCITCGPKKHGLVALSGKRYPNGEYPLSYPYALSLSLSLSLFPHPFIVDGCWGFLMT